MNTHKALPLALGCLLALPNVTLQAQSPKAKPKSAEVALGVVVVCVGGYCIYKIARFCQSKFPRKEAAATNAPPDLVGQKSNIEVGKSFLLDMDCSSAALPEGDSQSVGTNVVTTSLRISLNNGSLRTEVQAEPGWQDYASFSAEIAEHGLSLVSPGYELNRMPSNPLPLPAGSHRVKVSCSSDLTNWQTLLEASIDEGGSFGVLDATAAGMVFYKAELQ